MKKLLTFFSALTVSASLAFGVSNTMPDSSTTGATNTVKTTGGITIISSSPASGEVLAELPKGYIIKIGLKEFQDYPEMYLEYEIERGSSGVWEIIKSYTWMFRDDEDECYVAEVPRAILLEEGYDYCIKVSAWEKESDTHTSSDLKNSLKLGEAKVIFKGSSKPVVPSSYSLVSVTPEPSKDRYSGIITADEPFITTTFNGFVNLGTNKQTGIVLGMGAGLEAFASIDAIGETETVNGMVYAKEWKLVFPEGYIESCHAPVTVSVKATDIEGNILHHNEMGEDHSYWSWEYNVPGQYGDVTYDLGEEPREELNEIKASFASGIVFSHNMSYGAAYVEKSGKKVAEVVNVEQKFSSSSMSATSKEVTMILDKTLVAPGTYSLYVPDGYFTLGTQYTVYYQKAEVITFEIVGGETPDPSDETLVVFDPVGGNIDGLPEQIVLLFPEYEQVSAGTGNASIQYNDETPEVLPACEEGRESNEMIQSLGKFSGNVNEGIYTINFPAGYFSLGRQGHPSLATEVTYNINTTQIESVQVKSDRYIVYEITGTKIMDTINPSDLQSLRGLYIINGLKMILK